MAAELIVGPVFGLLLLGLGVFFASLLAYRQQQSEEKARRLRAYWQGIFCASTGHRLAIQWMDEEGWIVSLCDAPPGVDVAHFRAQVRGDTLTATLGDSGVALDLRFLADGELVSPLVPGLHGDLAVEPDWLSELLSGTAKRWRRE